VLAPFGVRLLPAVTVGVYDVTMEEGSVNPLVRVRSEALREELINKLQYVYTDKINLRLANLNMYSYASLTAYAS
jgi:hypothetical protein